MLGALAALAAGCGLALDYDPPEQRKGGLDAAVRDAGPGGDAGPPPGDGGEPECTIAADCADGNACNGTEACVEGVCTPGVPLGCDDMIPCTVDDCDSMAGCTHVPTDTLCPDVDGATCTLERCDGSSGCYIEIPPGACDDGIPCTRDVCAPTGAEECRHDPIDGFCGDGRCDPTLGCVGTMCMAHADCRPRACQTSPLCDEGRCISTALGDGTPCDDGNPCTASSACMAGECRGMATSLCRGQPCVVCNPLGAGCDGSIVAAPGTACDDGNRCTDMDSCMGAVCVSMTLTACVDDRNECTDDRCDPMTGSCDYRPLPGGTCEDGDACTHATICQTDGTCGGGGLTTCPVGMDPCVDYVCRPTDGMCVSRNRDGLPCPGGTCMGGTCCGPGGCGVVCPAGQVPCGDGSSCCPSACGTSCNVGAGEICCECTSTCITAECTRMRPDCCLCPA